MDVYSFEKAFKMSFQFSLFSVVLILSSIFWKLWNTLTVNQKSLFFTVPTAYAKLQISFTSEIVWIIFLV